MSDIFKNATSIKMLLFKKCKDFLERDFNFFIDNDEDKIEFLMPRGPRINEFFGVHQGSFEVEPRYCIYEKTTVYDVKIRLGYGKMIHRDIDLEISKKQYEDENELNAIIDRFFNSLLEDMEEYVYDKYKDRAVRLYIGTEFKAVDLRQVGFYG